MGRSGSPDAVVDPAPPELPPDRSSAVRRLLVRVLVTSAVLACLVVGLLRWRDGEVRLDHFHWGWMLVGGCAWTASLPLQAVRWRALLPPGQRPPVVPMMVFVVGANLFNLAVPGPSGEVLAATLAARRWPLSLPAAVCSSLLARVLALAVLGTLAAVLWPFLSVQDGVPIVWMEAAAVAVGLGTGLLWAVLRWPLPMVRAAERLAARLGAERLGSRLESLEDAFVQLGAVPLRGWVEAALASAVNTGIQGLGTFAAFASVGVSAPLLGLFYVHLLASLSLVVGIIVPGGVGAPEAVYGAFLPAVGGPGAVEAVIGALAVRQAQTLTMVFSIPALVWMWRGGAGSAR